MEEKKKIVAEKKYHERKLDQEFERRLKSIDLEDEDDEPIEETPKEDRSSKSQRKRWRCLRDPYFIFNVNKFD